MRTPAPSPPVLLSPPQNLALFLPLFLERVSELGLGAAAESAMAWGACVHAVLLLLLLLAGAGVHCREEKGALGRRLRMRSRTGRGAAVLELRHHGYSREPSKNREEETRDLFSLNDARISLLQWRIDSYRSTRLGDQSSKAQIPLASGVSLQTLNYVATIELGGDETTVIVDTGSDLTWVLCEPCTPCRDQQAPVFDPSSSPSYAEVPCNSSVCDTLQLATGTLGACDADQPAACSYTLSYRDGSYSRGVLGQDKLNLAGKLVDGFVFGCGTSNQGLFGRTSGLMGLGRNQLSLVSQTTHQFGGVFSYCLPLKESNSSGSLVLGDDPSAYRNSTPVVYTTMSSDPLQGPFYFLNLTRISIGSEAVQSPGFSAGKVIIDSGTIITTLPPSMYNAVKAEFLSQFTEYPQVPGFSILDTCFNLTGFREVQIPSLKFVFEGSVEVEVNSNGVLYFVGNDASQVCLALASLKSEYEIGIIGNYQQKNLRVIYDTVGSKIGFAEEACDYT